MLDNSLLNEQISNLTKINANLNEIDSLRISQIGEYQKLNTSYLEQVDKLNRELKKKDTAIKCWKIGGVTVSVGLILFLILK